VDVPPSARPPSAKLTTQAPPPLSIASYPDDISPTPTCQLAERLVIGIVLIGQAVVQRALYLTVKVACRPSPSSHPRGRGVWGCVSPTIKIKEYPLEKSGGGRERGRAP